MYNPSEISEIIKSYAQKKKVSIKQLLEDCKINKGFIYDLEHKSTYPSIDKMAKIANYLGIPIDFLLGTGVFSNWNEICEHKREIIATMEHFFEGHPEIIKILKFNDMTFASILNAIVNRIEFHDNDFDIYFSTSSEDNTKIKDPLTEQFIKIFEQLDFDDKVDVMQYVKNKK